MGEWCLSPAYIEAGPKIHHDALGAHFLIETSKLNHEYWFSPCHFFTRRYTPYFWCVLFFMFGDDLDQSLIVFCECFVMDALVIFHLVDIIFLDVRENVLEV